MMDNVESEWETGSQDPNIPSTDESGPPITERIRYMQHHLIRNLSPDNHRGKTAAEDRAMPLPNCTLLQGDIHTVQFETDKASVLNPANPYLNHNAGVAEALRARWPFEVAGHAEAMKNNLPLMEGQATKHAFYTDHEVGEIVHVAYSPWNQVQKQVALLTEILEAGVNAATPGRDIITAPFGDGVYRYSSTAASKALKKMVQAHPERRFVLIAVTQNQLKKLRDSLSRPDPTNPMGEPRVGVSQEIGRGEFIVMANKPDEVPPNQRGGLLVITQDSLNVDTNEEAEIR